jgi:CubicO group peptidase (beta-lactamase class C family)
LPIANVPGRAYAYSNFGFCLLGRIIETVTGQSYQQHVASRILRRCGVQDMSVAANTESERHSREVSYYGQSGENPYGMNVRRMDSHGGWIGTARDLAAFAMHLDGRWTRARLLGAPTIATMTSSSTANRNYAKGWAVNQVGNWWHNGSLPGTTSIVVRTSSGLCWSALANSRRPGTPDVNRALDDMVWEMVRQVGDWRG